MFTVFLFVKVVGILDNIDDKESAQGVNNASGNSDAVSYHFDIEKHREGMQLKSPICDGTVSDWDLLEKIWDYALPEMLKMDSIQDIPVLIAEKPYNSSASRQR